MIKLRLSPQNTKLSFVKTWYSLEDVVMGRTVDSLTTSMSRLRIRLLWKLRNKEERQTKTANLSLLLKYATTGKIVHTGMSIDI